MIGDLLQQLPKLIGEQMPGVHAGVYAGQFNEQALRGRKVSCPGVLVTCLGWRKVPARDQQFAGQTELAIRMVGYCVSNDGRGDMWRTIEAIGIAEQLSALVDGRDFSIDGIGKAELDNAQNGYTEPLARLGHTIWPLYWTHRVSPQTPVTGGPQLYDWLRLLIDTDEQMTPGSIDSVADVDMTNGGQP